MGRRIMKTPPEHSYGCSMRVDDWEINFRCRTPHRMQHWSPYTYGTEAEDLTYTAKDLMGLRKAIMDY